MRNELTRRDFLRRSFKLGLAGALSSLVDLPLLTQSALAEGTIGMAGKKLLFVFLRGGNDGLNSVIPIQDSAYGSSIRSSIYIPKDAGTDYALTGPCDFPASGAGATYGYSDAIRLGNGFAALHPSLKFLAPLYNDGELAMIHRVGYPRQSRSHFDSQDYWESAKPGTPAADGVLYRTIMASGLTATSPLTGISVQSSLPLLLHGAEAAMTNLTDPLRYELLGIPGDTGVEKARASIRKANGYRFPDKKHRDLLQLHYDNMDDTLDQFAAIDFTESGNAFIDDVNTDGDAPYYLFPTENSKNGGYALHGNDTNKFVVPDSEYYFFDHLKAVSLILNRTDAFIAGTQLGGFDHHSSQGGVTGAHADLARCAGWALYALQKYFKQYGIGGAQASGGEKVSWNDLVVVFMSEFGRRTVENSDSGTDHGESGVLFVAGGGVQGYGRHSSGSGVIACGTADPVPWVTGATGSMFAMHDRYLKRCVDFRSVLGEIIRDHLGVTQNQLDGIIPAYTSESEEHLKNGGTVVYPVEEQGVSTEIMGEVGVI